MRASLAIGVALAAALAFPPTLMAAGKTHTVRIEGIKFIPERIEVAAGDTVDWVNNDVVPHTVTAAGGSIESGSIAPEAHWKWTARRAGEIRYICRFHPGMQGILVVK